MSPRADGSGTALVFETPSSEQIAAARQPLRDDNEPRRRARLLLRFMFMQPGEAPEVSNAIADSIAPQFARTVGSAAAAVELRTIAAHLLAEPADGHETVRAVIAQQLADRAAVLERAS